MPLETYHYPDMQIPETVPLQQQAMKASDELYELAFAFVRREGLERILEEYCDAEHALEQLRRMILQMVSNDELQAARKMVIAKNGARGYYEIESDGWCRAVQVSRQSKAAGA